MEKIECPNCKSANVLLYCSNCGQKRVEGRLTFSELASDTLTNFIYVEKRFILTIKSLFANPKELIRSYSSGARKRFAVPVQFFLFFLTFYLLLYSFFGRDLLENVRFSFDASEADVSNEQIDSSIDIQQAIEKYMNYLYFLLPPIMAFYIRLMFRKTINYAEAVVLAFYVEAINLLLAILFIIAPANDQMYGFKAFASLVWFVYVFAKFDSKWFRGVVKGAIILVLGLLSFSLIIASLIMGIAAYKGLV